MVLPNPNARLRSMPPQFSRYDTDVGRIFIGRSIESSFLTKGRANTRPSASGCVFSNNQMQSWRMGQILHEHVEICSFFFGGNSVTDSDILEDAHSSKQLEVCPVFSSQEHIPRNGTKDRFHLGRSAQDRLGSSQ